MQWYRKKMIAAGAGIVVCMGAVLAAGLQKSRGGTEYRMAEVAHEVYVKSDYEATEVREGDLTPILKFSIKADSTQTREYRASGYGLEVEKVHVKVGDKVKAGDIMVSFKSDSLKETMEQYEEQIRENNLLTEHYTRLMEIDPSEDYAKEIADMDRDNEIARLYVEEARDMLDRYQIVAEREGTVTWIDHNLLEKEIKTLEPVMTVVGGLGNYIGEVQESCELEKGRIYTADADAISYQLKLVDVAEEKGKGNENKRRLTFEPVSDMSALPDDQELTLSIEKPTVRNCLYVDEKAIHSTAEGFYVYTLDENGYRDAVWVTIGDLVGQYRIITEGLKAGQRLAY